jgi:hypothetical protein
MGAGAERQPAQEDQPPSASSVVLDFESNLDSRYTHYESDEAQRRPEAVLADADLMTRLQTRINDIWGPYLNEASAEPSDLISGPHSVAPILPEVERPRGLQHFLDRYQPFEADTPAGRVTFAGRGNPVATPFEERSLAEWASLVHQELRSGRSGASWGLAVALKQEGMHPCSRVQIEVYG